MRWFFGALLRAIAVLPLCVAGMWSAAMWVEPSDADTVVPIALRTAALLLLWIEWAHLNRVLQKQAAHLEHYLVAVPDRPDRRVVGMFWLQVFFWTSTGLWCAGVDWPVRGGVNLALANGIRAGIAVLSLALLSGGFVRLRFLWLLRRTPDSPWFLPCVPWFSLGLAWLQIGSANLAQLAATPSGATDSAVDWAEVFDTVMEEAARQVELQAQRDQQARQLQREHDALSHPAPSAATTRGAVVELLVELGPDDHISELQPTLSQAGAQAQRAFGDGHGPDLDATWIVTVPESGADVLAFQLLVDRENVDRVEGNPRAMAAPAQAAGACSPESLLGSNDPYGQQALAGLGGRDALGLLAGNPPRKRAVLAVLDTGVQGDHPDLLGIAPPWGVDRHGHGTAMASIAAANTHNARGLASLNLEGRHIDVLSWPVLYDGAGADDVARAILEAADAGVDVINLSLGADGQPPPTVALAVTWARRQDVVVVAAAGNDGGYAAGTWPANVPGVLVVGSSTAFRGGRSSSVLGVPQAVLVPGDNLCAATPDGGYQRVDGTSAATALVSGVAATMRSVCPNLPADDVIEAIVNAGGRDTGGGSGALRLDQLYAGLLNGYLRCY